MQYYIDGINGNDYNDGFTTATAWKTPKRANSVLLAPGDEILFKRGGTYVGSLIPKGSGTKDAPIVISAYGEGSRPILMPSPEDPITKDSVDTYFQEYWYVSTSNTPFKGVDQILLKNVEHYEIRDLELYDPNYDANCPVYTGGSGEYSDDSGNNYLPTGDMPNQRYRRGITIYAEDTGDLRGFVIDNVAIHGYRGTNSNRGKSAGGIIIQINTSPDMSKQVPTAIHDITVTNCELHHLGRSGINFTSPWCGRTHYSQVTDGDDWGDYGYPSSFETAGWLPCENIYFANNVIYDIDGDGIIIDNCKNVLVECNKVYRTHLRCRMAVGIFPWNSDNVVIQYNEVFDTSPEDHVGSRADSQGIEIDALCRDVIVQYNYLYNNFGGFLMNCNTDDLRGFRHTFRYNVSRYEGNGFGVIDWHKNCIGGEVYGNTVLINADSGYFFANKHASEGGPGCPKISVGHRFYDNTFIYDGGNMKLSDANGEWAGEKYQLRLDSIEWTSNKFINFPAELTHALLGGEDKGNVIANVGPAGPKHGGA